MEINFSQIDDEDLEFLTADLLRCQNFTIEFPPGRGPDQGKDLIAVRSVTDDLGFTDTERCLVECKHFFVSDKSVRESDIGNFEIKMKQHNANRYLLVTTSNVSETVKNQLVAVSKDESNSRKATYWVKSDLIERLQKNPDLIKKYFRSWQHEANEAAIYVHNHLFPAHRGALLWCPGVTAIFGNDGYKAPQVKTEIEFLQTGLSKQQIESLAFATDDEKYSWVLLVRSNDARVLHDFIWKCFDLLETGHDMEYIAHEKHESFLYLYSYFSTPHKPKSPI